MTEIDVSMCCHYWAGGCEEGGITKKCSDRNCYYKQRQQFEAENEALKEKLEKVKSTLELYANSKIGTLQDNGTYKIDCGGNTVMGSFGLQISNPFGLPSTFTYDPRPAKEALKLIKGEIDE